MAAQGAITAPPVQAGNTQSSSPVSGTVSGGKPAGGKSSAAGGISAIVFLLLACSGLVVLLFAFLSMSSGPSANGSNGVARAIDVSPDSEDQAVLADFTRYTDTSTYLQQNSSLLTELKTSLLELDSKLVTDQEYSSDQGKLSAENVNKAKAIITEMNAFIVNIQTQVAAGTPKNAQKYVDGLRNDILRLQRITMLSGSVVQVATSVVDFNKDGTGEIKYDKKKRLTGKVSNGMPAYLDCSGFVTYVLRIAGVIPAGADYNVESLATTAKAGSKYFTVVKESDTAISANDVKSSILPGDILLSTGKGGTLSNPVTDSDGDGTNHAVIYLGENKVAHSTNRSDKHGPQYNTLEARLSLSGAPIQMIIRPVTQ